MAIEETTRTDDLARSRTVAIDGQARSALALLAQAYWFAVDAGADLWDFALEIDALLEARLTISHLRWLVAKGLAEHGQESSVYGGPHRSFRRGDGFYFDPSTCVVLTPDGAAFVGRFLGELGESPRSVGPVEVAPLAGVVPARPDHGPRPDPDADADADPDGRPRARSRPCWHSMRRELCVNGQVVKRYRVRARNQEAILNAFEEERWPEQIDDPLPVSVDIDPRTRLHDAINRLNCCQARRLLRFRGNGAGTGVSWELRHPVAVR